MKTKNSRFAILSCLALSYCSGAWADQVTLKNGDRVTGEIVKKDGATLTIKSAHFGVVTLPWAEVDSIKADTPLTVVLPEGKTVKAAITSQDGQVRVAAPEAPQPVPQADIVALRNDAEQKIYERFVKPGLLDLWTVTGSLNLAGTKGNAVTRTITTPINFARISKTSRTAAYFNSIRASALANGLNSQTANAVRGGWSYGRDVSKRVFLNGFNDYEYDKFQSLDLRVVLGGGGGYHAWAGESGKLDILAGVAYNREKFDPAPQPTFVRNSAEGYWGDDFSFKLTSRTSLVQGFRMFNNLSNTGEYRINFDIGANTKLTRWLIWNISLSDRYLSNPVVGRKANDFLYTTGLGFTFAR